MTTKQATVWQVTETCDKQWRSVEGDVSIDIAHFHADVVYRWQVISLETPTHIGWWASGQTYSLDDAEQQARDAIRKHIT